MSWEVNGERFDYAAAPPEHVARHEAGHAVAFAVLGRRFSVVSVDTDPPAVQPLPPDAEPGEPGWPAIGCQWLTAVAGAIADQQGRGLRMPDYSVVALLTGAGLAPDGRFDVLDRSGAVAVRPPRTPGVAEGCDLWSMAGVMTEDEWAAPLVIAVWRDCEQFTAGCAPAIAAVAGRLLKRRTLTFEEVARLTAAALPEPPPVPPWAAWTPGDWERRLDAYV